MSILLAIFSFPGANATVARHYPYFQRQQADWIYGIGTTDGGCKWPKGVTSLDVGANRYIEGPALPNRLLDTIEVLLLRPWQVLILCEYDTLILKPVPAEKVETVAAYRAGSATWGSKANSFFHNPWLFARDSAQTFLATGRKAIAEGICPDRGRGVPSTPECSPDVFTGYVFEQAGLPVQTELYREYSRNSFDHPEHLEEARQAYLAGYEIIHGVKSERELHYITTGNWM